MFGLFRKKRIDRDQWSEPNPESMEIYRNMMRMDREALRGEWPEFFHRLEFAVSRSRGTVLEIGCGIGNMTRWLAESPEVERVLAVDGFPSAIEMLREYDLPKTEPLLQKVEAIRLEPGLRVDTVLCCELIEHLYADEEKAMLRAIRPHVSGETRYVVSTPIGFLPDPHHVRGFDKKPFRRHLERHYGPVEEIDYGSGYSQSGFGRFRD